MALGSQLPAVQVVLSAVATDRSLDHCLLVVLPDFHYYIVSSSMDQAEFTTTDDQQQNDDQCDEDSPLKVSSDFEKLIDSITSDGQWTDILENKQLLKQIVHPGDQNGERPQRGNKVTITVKTKLLGQDDSLVQSECLENADIFVSEYDVMHGVDLAIPLMYPGETARVLIHPRFGYSTAGKEPDVPPDAAFDCEITLHSVEFVECETGLPIEERIKYGKLLLLFFF